MSANHNTLGFTHDMPGATGDIQVVTPAAEQFTELQKRALERAETAGNVSAMLDELPGGLGANVKDFVVAANEDAERTGVLDSAIVADEVAIGVILHGEGSHAEIASTLGARPDESFREAIVDTGITEGEYAAESVLKEIDDAEAEADEAQLGSVTLQQLRAEIANKTIDVVDRKLWGIEIQELSNDLQATRDKDLAACAEEQTAHTGVENPNSHSKGLFIGDPADGVPMHENSAYRTVDVRAIVDLIDSGVVRGAYTATGGERSQTESHTTHWSDGEEGRRHRFKSDGAFTIEAPKKALDAGWVTADKVTGIYTRDQDRRLVNLLNAQEIHSEPSLDVGHDRGEGAREVVDVELTEIKQKLDECGEDSQKRIEVIASYMRLDEEGRTRSLDSIGLYELANAIPAQRMVHIMTGEYAKDFQHMAELMSTLDISDDGKGSLSAHMKVLRMLESSEGSAPLEWRRQLRAGEPLSVAAQNYADKPNLARAVMDNVTADMTEKMKSHIFVKEKMEAVARYSTTASEAVKHVLDLDNNPGLQSLATSYLNGDLRDYGYTSKEGGIKTVTAAGIYDIASFVTNVDSVGREGIARLHADLGTVNFGGYTAQTLKNMLDIIENPQDYQHQGIGVIVRGVNGDYNRALGTPTESHDLKGVLCVEIGQLSDVESVNEWLDQNRMPLNRLTISGHGGEQGIHISKTAILRRDKASVGQAELKTLFDHIVPDSEGVRAIILNSCSQGKKYDARGSMAEIVSAIDTTATVTAAPGVSYTNPSERIGEFVIATNPYYGLAGLLERNKGVPGFARLSKYLIESERVRKLGVVHVRDGVKSIDTSGKVYIGA